MLLFEVTEAWSVRKRERSQATMTWLGGCEPEPEAGKQEGLSLCTLTSPTTQLTQTLLR